jgi:hypothetical protein
MELPLQCFHPLKKGLGYGNDHLQADVPILDLWGSFIQPKPRRPPA